MERTNTTGATAFTLLSVACLTIMVGCVLVPGLPVIATQLGVAHHAGWLVTTPALGVVLFGPAASGLIDRCGLRRALLLGLTAYGLLGAAGMFVVGAPIVLADRLLLGAATAVVMSAGTGMISALYEGRARLDMIARQGMAIELGGVIFLALAGLLAQHHWQWPFLLYLLAWLLALLVRAFVPDTEPVLEAAAGTPARQVIPAALKQVFFAAAASMVVFFAAIITLPGRLAECGVNPTETGYLLSFVSLVAVAAAACMPRVVSRLGEFGTLTLAFALYAVAHGIFAVSGEAATFAAGGVALGLGFGLSIPLVNHMTVERSLPQQRSRYLAWLSMAIFAGQFIASLMDLPGADRRSGFVTAAGIAVASLLGLAIARGTAAGSQQRDAS